VSSAGKIAIVVPVYNDWASFVELVSALDAVVADWGQGVHLVAVDDGSIDRDDRLGEAFAGLSNLAEVTLCRLVSNLGHQRAIAVGLSELCRDEEVDAVIVMDSDGEDRPEDLPALKDAFLADPDRIVVAQRARRSEGWWFRVLYRLYRLTFLLLTGRRIDFGNFLLIPRRFIEPLTHSGLIWNHLASAVVRLRLPVRRVPTARGRRYAGTTKMNPVSLVIHGLSAMSVFSDTVFVRVLLVSLLLSLMTAAAIVAVVLIRLLTDLAIPGWASNAVGILFVIFLQAWILSAGAAVLLLTARSQRSVIPALDADRHVRDRSVLFRR
jgi:polyisoprenyl-phosphate glycosyltransferase